MSSEEAVKEWLEKTGYPLEMEVANVWRMRGFNVFQSDFYTDPKTKEYREIDVVAYSGRQVGESNYVKFRFLCECKTSRDKPWLLFVDDTAKPHDRILILNRAGNRIGANLLQRAQRTLAQHAPLFRFDRAPAYGVAQALRKKDNDLDTSYAALMQAANAARVRAEESRAVHDGDIPEEIADAEIFIPIVVVEGELFDVMLGSDLKPALKAVERQVVLWRNPVGGTPFTVVHVVRKDRVGVFISDVKSGIEALYNWCDRNVDEALRSFHLPVPNADF